MVEKYKFSFPNGLPNSTWSFTHKEQVVFTLGGGQVKTITKNKDNAKYLSALIKEAKQSKTIKVKEE